MNINTDPPGWTGLEPGGSGPWSVIQRLDFIESTLYWRGHINRSDLVDRYQISLPQASSDLQKYIEIAGEGVSYDNSARTYVAKPSFVPRITKPGADRYLMQILGWRRGTLQRPDVVPSESLSFDELPIPRRVINTDILRSITQSITARRIVRINYQSMTRPAPTWREISPHALAFDRLRWHVRAYCHERNEFRDFVLTRIFSVEDLHESSIDPNSDVAWNTYVIVKIAPHPELTEDQRKAIAFDYGMTDSTTDLKVRAAMLFYLMRAMRWTGTNDQPPIEQQIVVINRAELDDALRMHTPAFAESNSKTH